MSFFAADIGDTTSSNRHDVRVQPWVGTRVTVGLEAWPGIIPSG
jgi:hypothetical protein